MTGRLCLCQQEIQEDCSMDKKSFFDKFKKNLPEGPVRIDKSAKAPPRGVPMKKGGIPDVARLQMQAQQSKTQQEQAARPDEARQQMPLPPEQPHAGAPETADEAGGQYTIVGDIADGVADDFPDSAEAEYAPPGKAAFEEVKAPPQPPGRPAQRAPVTHPPQMAPLRRGSPQDAMPPVTMARPMGRASRVPPRQQEKKSTPVWMFSVAGLAAVILIVWGVCSAIQSAKRVPVHLSLVYSDGEPYLIRKGSKRKAVLPPGGLLRVGNTVETSNYPRTIIQVEKDNYFIAGQDTQFTVLSMRKVQGMKDIILKLKLDKGRLWVDHPKWFRVTVETPLIQVEPEVGSTEIKVVDKGDVKVLSWRGQASFRPLVGKNREPHPDQVISLGEREMSSVTVDKIISPTKPVELRAMDSWEAWNLGIKLPEVVNGELLDPDTAFKAMQKNGFAYSKMYYGQPEPDPEPTQADQEDQGDVGGGPPQGGDVAMNDTGDQGPPQGNKGGPGGAAKKAGKPQSGPQGGMQQGGMKQGGMQQGGMQQGGMQQGGMQQGGMQQGGMQQGGMQQGGMQQGGMQQGGMQQGGMQKSGMQQGGMQKGGQQSAFNSAWQGGTLSQGGGMKGNSAGSSAFNQGGGSKKSAYPTASGSKGNRQGSSQTAQNQPPQLPQGDSMKFQKYQGNDNKKPPQRPNDSGNKGGGPGGGGPGGGQKNIPVADPMQEVKAPRGFTGGEQDTVSKKALPGYALGGNPVTEGMGNKETGAYRSAPPGYGLGEAPVAGDNSEGWQKATTTASGADLWYRITNAASGSAKSSDSQGGVQSGSMNYWVEVQNRGRGAAQSVTAEIKCYSFKGEVYFCDSQTIGNLAPGQKGDATLMFPRSGQSQRMMIEIKALGGQTSVHKI
jgi:hypothetical protein